MADVQFYLSLQRYTLKCTMMIHIMPITFVLLILGLRNDVEFAFNDAKSFDHNSFEAFASPGRHTVLIHCDMDIKILTEIPQVDFWAFVSAIGGSLGLFLGFSIIDTMLFTYKYVLKIK